MTVFHCGFLYVRYQECSANVNQLWGAGRCPAAFLFPAQGRGEVGVGAGGGAVVPSLDFP